MKESREKIINMFKKILEETILLNRYLRYERKDIRNSISPISWAKEFCTVALNVGRQIGKTSYILEHATEYDIIIVHSHNMRNHFLNQQLKCKAKVISKHELIDVSKNKSSSSTVYRNIYVDEFSLINKDEKNKIYECFVKAEVDQTFIFLG